MPSSKTMWVVITGGVISTLGKGVVSGSLGSLLQQRGYNVSAIKIDPYLNIDAGTMRPTEHGEVFVTYDGGETDQDIGNYERFLGKKISKENNITSGQVYEEVLRKERNLDYKGKCVQVMHHIPEEIERRLRASAKKDKPDVMLIEIGGTVGDYENLPFLETVRRMKLEGEDVAFIHTSYMPVPKTAGEMKSKPTQHSVKSLSSHGIQADYIVARSTQEVDEIRKKKISLFCNVAEDNVISCPDVDSIYKVPLKLKEQKLDQKILEQFNLEVRPIKDDWEKLLKKPKEKVKIGIIGKYFKTGDFTLDDSYISVIEAIKHAAIHEEVEAKIDWLNADKYEKGNKEELEEYHGLIVPGGFGASAIEGKVQAIKHAREKDIPFLGLCYGLQLAVVEHARNNMGLEAHTTEIDGKTPNPVVSLLPDQIEKIENNDYGATMRLGEYKAKLKKGTLIRKLYSKEEVKERHRHRYEVNPEYNDVLQGKGLVFSGMSPDKKLVEFLEREDNTYFVATQAHPEFTSSPLKPNPLFSGLISAAVKRLNLEQTK